MPLSSRDHEVLAEALRAAANGPFFPDWEFHSLFGLTREEVRRFASSYQPQDDVPVKLGIAVHDALGNLLGYPHGLDKEWSRWLSVSREELEAIFSRWRSDYGYQ